MHRQFDRKLLLRFTSRLLGGTSTPYHHHCSQLFSSFSISTHSSSSFSSNLSYTYTHTLSQKHDIIYHAGKVEGVRSKASFYTPSSSSSSSSFNGHAEMKTKNRKRMFTSSATIRSTSTSTNNDNGNDSKNNKK